MTFLSRTTVAGLVAAMAVGSLALWTIVPGGWLFATRGMESAGGRFLISITGCVLTMLALGALLYRLEGFYLERSGARGREVPTSTWLRSAGEDQRKQVRLSLLDKFMVASAILALLALVTWWSLLADSPNPSGPLQPL